MLTNLNLVYAFTLRGQAPDKARAVNLIKVSLEDSFGIEAFASNAKKSSGNIMERDVYIADGAGFSGDRFDAAVPLVAHLATCKGPRYLMFEVLAERTIAQAQIAKAKDPGAGYSPYLENYLRPILRMCKKPDQNRFNMGAANPAAAASHIHRLADEMGGAV